MKIRESTELWCLKCHQPVVIHTLSRLECSCTTASAQVMHKIRTSGKRVTNGIFGQHFTEEHIYEGEVDIPYWVRMDSETAKLDRAEQEKKWQQKWEKEQDEEKELIKKWEKKIGKPLLKWFVELPQGKQEEIQVILDPYNACFGDIKNLNHPELRLAQVLEKGEIKWE